MNGRDAQLDELLARSGAVAPDALAAACAQQLRTPDRPLAEILIEAGSLAETDWLRLLADHLGMELVPAVPPGALDPQMVAQVPVEWARQQTMLPLRHGAGVGVLMCDPTRLAALEDLALLLDREVVPLLAPRREILRAIEQCYYQKTDRPADLLRSLGATEGAPGAAAPAPRSDDLLRSVDQAPVTQLINLVLLEAVKAGASDVHIEPFRDVILVRYRIDGWLYPQSSPPRHLEAALVSRLKVMAHLDIAERRLPQDGVARVRVGEREIDIRISTIPVAEGERVVLRLLNREAVFLPLHALGMSEAILEQFRAVLRAPNGVVLVTGPTGSGKTTTLYGALQELDTERRNILTIEDPIEYQLPRIGQMQVKPKIGLTFAQGLRHILRQDPDVILVGETRDLETAEIVIRASLTGHLVFTTLHTNDAAGAILRLTDMGVAPYLLGAALRAALAQRLVRKLCPHCRRAGTLSAAEAAQLGLPPGPAGERGVWRAQGCPACLDGYKGRTGIYEFLPVGAALQEAIRRGAGLREIRQTAGWPEGGGLLADGLARMFAGITSPDELLRAVGSADAASAS